MNDASCQTCRFYKYKKQIQWSLYIVCIAIAVILCLWNFEIYGDIFRLMPIFVGLLLLVQKKYILLRDFIITCVIVLGIAFGCKMGFAFLAAYYGDSESIMSFVQIAKRPINGEFKGFPSGHTTAAFIVVAFGWIYCSMKWKILLLILALLVGYSRIYSTWHTSTQVICGALLGLGLGFVLLWILKKTHHSIDKMSDKDYNPSLQENNA
uniref:Phosphatidic acid phosphatase type 2/haloperoxidase domain-containing protein n=1 Tax=uncultured Helicobacter sp. TaxID=175537 RepID=A0A650EM81_9HELI|nr:hypothetical protein Helico5904_0730 [uncultured Helicobacter sp.]